ncbi:hypothetical protein Mal15_05350 [Stieleria maiorica]|uniref:Uncharacterized protein n=1 Tax=Stieleria maiorica TaxID=2795974 RepID=A0A5B9MBD2_9BACT|nr:hypothetical protein [Stieleria maiorica]QEF96507.1 hypothetical protein Mal15_05350 [Stieleria maiorica]
MDAFFKRCVVTAALLITTHTLGSVDAPADAPKIQFDMPAVVVAQDTSLPGQATGLPRQGREVSVQLVLSSLIAGRVGVASQDAPPIDHLLVRCRMRDRLPVIDFAPKTELQSDFAGPISVTNKDEQSDSIGLNLDGVVPHVGAAHFGADESRKRSDSTEFQRQAPVQAVIASGTIDRGRGVYFKFRWTTQQVLEGEKLFRVSFAVPESWRGGLLEVSITAHGVDHSLFGSSKLRPRAQQDFVVAVHQQGDLQAADIALRLAHLDRKLAAFARQHPKSGSNPISQLWRRVVPPDADEPSESQWYQGITSNRLDPYTDQQIRSLPMQVRVAVLGYSNAARELLELGQEGS